MLTAGNAVFVAAEFSLVTVDRALVAQRARAGDRRAASVEQALHTLSFQLSGAQLGITITALTTGYLAEPAFARLISPLLDPLPGGGTVWGERTAIVLALLVATLFSMLFGELVPKNLALASPVLVARIAAPIQRGFSSSLRPVIRVFNGSANWIVRRLGVEPSEELASARSAEELGLLASISAQAGALPLVTARLLQRTLRFPDKHAAEAMTPRVDVIALPAAASAADLLEVARASGHSRFPIYIDTLDQVIGVAAVSDALAIPLNRRTRASVRRIAAQPLRLPGSLDLDSALNGLRGASADLAIVVDEYGGTDGILTMEDLVEELVGEISDEYDTPPTTADLARPITAPGEDPTRLVSGLLHADELAEQIGFRVPRGPYETLAGFLMARLGHIPVEGESVDERGWEFTVVSVERHRIEQVKVKAPPSAERSGS